MDVTIPGISEALTGKEPIVILGANGSGKTRLAVQMAKAGSMEFIPALRNIALPDQLPNRTLQDATNDLTNKTNRRKEAYWELIPDIDALFGKLLSAHAVEAMRVYDEVRRKAPITISETVLAKTESLWKTVFPGRSITFADFSARVSNDYFGATTYTAKQMSDGERAGLYLAARVLDSNLKVVIIDEPETHFHSRLAVRFWDALESLCADKRFVYITHDLNFALSRRSAQIILARPNQVPELINAGSSLPSEDIASILGAASFSIYAKRLIFCEGQETKSLDQELLRAWFNDKATALIPVGGCENVKRCTSAFNTATVVSGFKASGIIDRDHWPDDILAGLDNIHVLPVHEIESLYALPAVFQAVAIHLGYSDSDAEERYRSLLANFRKQMSGVIANKLIYQRFRARSLMLLERAFADTSIFEDSNILREQTVNQLRKTQPITDAEEIWDEESRLVELALASSDPTVFLRVFPGKPLVGLTATNLGLTKERYCEIIKSALELKETALSQLSIALETAFSPYLPARLIAEEQATAH